MPTIFNVVVDAVVRHWESLVAERAEGGISNDNEDAAQPAGRTIRARDDRRWREEEGHTHLKVREAFLKCGLRVGGFHQPMVDPVCV